MEVLLKFVLLKLPKMLNPASDFSMGSILIIFSTKKLKQLYKNILDQLAVLLNHFFSSDIIPSLLKTKKNDSKIRKMCKLECWNQIIHIKIWRSFFDLMRNFFQVKNEKTVHHWHPGKTISYSPSHFKIQKLPLYSFNSHANEYLNVVGSATEMFNFSCSD